jgi:hypothetical protein
VEHKASQPLTEIAPKGVKGERDDAGRRQPLLLSDLITNSSLITRKEFARSIRQTSTSQWIKKERLLSLKRHIIFSPPSNPCDMF